MKKLFKTLSVSFILIMLLIMYLPILFIVIFSFSGSKTMSFETFNFTFSLFSDLLNNEQMLEAFANSMLIGFVSALLATFIGVFSAIGLFHSKKKIRGVIEYSGQITMFNADIVTALAMLVFFVFIKLDNDWTRLIIGHTIICLPYVIMSIMPRLSQLDPNVYEAGLDLGASPIRTLFTVILPQLAGGMIAGFALAFTISLDDFTITKIVGDSVNTIPTYLYNGLTKGGLDKEIRVLSTVLLVGIMLVLVLVNVFSAKRKKKLLQSATA